MSVTHVIAAGLCEVCGETAAWIDSQTWLPVVGRWLGGEDSLAVSQFAYHLALGNGSFVETIEANDPVSLPAEWALFNEGAA